MKNLNSKSEEEKDILNQIENIPDNTQVVSPKVSTMARRAICSIIGLVTFLDSFNMSLI